MMTRTVIAAALLAGAWLACGCGSNPQPKATDRIIPSSERQASYPASRPAVDQMDASAGTAEMLAQRTRTYSQEMGGLLDARAGMAPPVVPSAVKWIELPEISLDSSPIRPSGDRATPSGGATVRQTLETTTVAPVQSTGLEPDEPPAPARQAAVRPAAAGSDALPDKLSRRVKDYPRDVSAHLEYQLLQFLLDEQVPQLAGLSLLPSEDREMISAVLDGLTNFRNALRADNNMLLSKKIKPILEMAERLRAQADLTISAIALCTKVSGFGSYDPIDPVRFPANADNRAIVYCEIANFTSSLNDKQLWETRLTWDLTLYTDIGMSVWSDKTETIVDTTRNRRHDFFVRKQITLPKALTIGRYLLKASIVDAQANRVAEATIPLIIAAQ
jgi:hypothetical protein